MQRPASGVWEGLATKLERFRAAAGSAAPVEWSATWAARGEEPHGPRAGDTPAARLVAHLGCYGTALTHRLAESGATVRALQLRLTGAAPGEAGSAAEGLALEVRVHAPELEQGALRSFALSVEPTCAAWRELAASGRLTVRAYTIEPGAEQPVPPVLSS